MARERMVTRTIETKNINAWVLNTTTGTTREGIFIAPMTLKTDAKILEYLNEAYKEMILPEERITAIRLSTVQKTKYAMLEREFIQHATILDYDDYENEEGEE